MKTAISLTLAWFSLTALGLDEHACRLYYRRLAHGDPGAMAGLIGSIDSDLRGFIYSRVRDRAAVDDITQEVYLVLWKAKSLPREDLKASDWVLAIAKNKIRHYFEGKRKQPGASDPEVLAETVVDTRSPIEGSSKTYSHLAHELNRALRCFLFSEQNAMILQRNAEGMAYPKIIEELSLDLSPSGMTMRLAALRKTWDAAIGHLPEVLDRLLTNEEKTLFWLGIEGKAPTDRESEARVLAMLDTLTRHLAAFGVEGADHRISAAEREWLLAQTLDAELRDLVALIESGMSSSEVVRRLNLNVGDTGVQARFHRAQELLRLAANEGARVSREHFNGRELELLRLAAEGFSPAHIQFRLGLKSSPSVIADSIRALQTTQKELYRQPGAVAVDRRTFASNEKGEVVETSLGKGLKVKLAKSLGGPRAAFLSYLEAGLAYEQARSRSGIVTDVKTLMKTVDNWRRKIRSELAENRELANGSLEKLTAEEREFLTLAQRDGGEKAVRDFYKAPWTNLYIWHRAHQIRERLR